MRNLESLLSQASKPFILLRNQRGKMQRFHSAAPGRRGNGLDEHRGNRRSINTRSTGHLKLSDPPLGPPRGGCDESFDRLASNQREKTRRRAQRRIAEQIQHPFELPGGGFPHRHFPPVIGFMKCPGSICDVGRWAETLLKR